MAAKLKAYGGYGDAFDDGVNDGVKKVIVREDSHGLVHIKIQYVRYGYLVKLEPESETETEITETVFEVKYPDEYITWIGGTYRDDHRYDDETMLDRMYRISRRTRRSQSTPAEAYIEAPNTIDMNDPKFKFTVSELQFKTSHGRTSQKFGKPGPGSIEFELEGKNGTKLVGIHGCSGRFLNSIGAYFALVSSAFKQLEPQGGSDGASWDDGAYDGLRKVCVGEDGGRVSSLEFVYAKGKKSITHCHGLIDSNERKEFELEYKDGEYIKSVEGTIDEDGLVSSLIFNTSMDRSSEEFGKAVANNKFFLKASGFDKLVGFRGRSCVDRIHALGASFAVVLAPPVKKLEAQGTYSGEEWDDGVHDDVRMITIVYGYESVKSVKFEYANGTETVFGDAHGNVHSNDEKEELKLYSDNEYITSVEGFCGQKLPASALGCDDITMLTFNTNIRTYSVLEHNPGDSYEGTPFKLEEKDHKIVGFHGKSSALSLQQIGAYVKPIDDA